MSLALRASADEVSSMAEELGLSNLLGLTSPDGSPSKGSKASKSPKKVTKEVIYKKFDKQWDKASHGVLKDRYESKPHKPPVLDKRDLARLADPIKGRYKSLAEYEDKMAAGELEESAEDYTGVGVGAFLTDIGIENRSNMGLDGGASGTRDGIFLTDNADGSVSPMKQQNTKNPANAVEQQNRNVQYNRSGGAGGFQRGGEQGSGVSSRYGAVSRLKGKLEEASRLDYRRNRGLQSSVLNASSDRLSAGIANRRGAAPGQKRFGASTSNLRSVRSSGYGLQNTTGGIPSRGRGGAFARNPANNSAGGLRGGGRATNPPTGRRGSRKEDPNNKSMNNENLNPNERRGRVYSRPGVPRLSRQPSGSARSKSRGRGGPNAAAEEKSNNGKAKEGFARSRAGASGAAGAGRGRVSRENSAGAGNNSNSRSSSRLSRSASRTRATGASRETSSRGNNNNNNSSANGSTFGSSRRDGGGPASRSGSAGGGLAAVRERRAGAGAGAGAGGEERGKDVSFKRLGAKESAVSRKRREDAIRRSQKGQNNNNNNNDNSVADDAIHRPRNSESAPSTRRPGDGNASSRRKSGPQSVGTQSSRSRTAGSTMKKTTNTLSNPLSASSSAPLHTQTSSTKGTEDVLKTLAGVQESEQKRQDRAATEDAATATATAGGGAGSSASSSRGKMNPSQALSSGPGGRGTSKASGIDSKDAAVGPSGTDSGSMAALLAAKASKLQAQFQKADTLRSSFQAVDEAESIALNLETKGLGVAAAAYNMTGTATTAAERFSSPSTEKEMKKENGGMDSPSKNKSSKSLGAGAGTEKASSRKGKDVRELQTSMDQEKLRSMIESDKGLDDL